MDQKEEIKQKLDIVSIIGRYVDLKKSGSNYKALCPFHSENTPSFMVSQEMQIFKCFGCGKAGDIFTFLMEMEGVEFVDALKQLAEEANVELKDYNLKDDKKKSKSSLLYEINELALKFYQYTLIELDVGKKALKYLKERDVSKKAIEEFKLGYAPKSWDSLHKFLTEKKGYNDSDVYSAGLVKKNKQGGYYDVYRGRVIFPLENQGGKVVGFAGRTIFDEDPKYINTKDTPVFNKSSYIYNLNRAKIEIRRENKVVVTEGEFDAITPFIKGMKNIVALKGTSFTSGQVELLKRYAETAVFILDSDTAGREATLRSIALAQNKGLDIRVASLPRKYKDPDEAARQSIDILQKAVEDAIPFFDYFFKYVSEKYDLGDALESNKAYKFILQRLNELQSNLLKSSYTKKASEFFDVDEDKIIDDLKNFKKENVVFEGVSKKGDSKNKSDLDNIEEGYSKAVLNLLQANKKLAHKFFKKFTEKDLLNESEEELLKEYFSKDISDISKENKGIIQDIKLRENRFTDEDIDNQEYMLKRVLKNQEVENLKKKIQSLTAEIKEAEKLEDREKLANLQKKFKMLTRELAQLK